METWRTEGFLATGHHLDEEEVGRKEDHEEGGQVLDDVLVPVVGAVRCHIEKKEEKIGEEDTFKQDNSRDISDIEKSTNKTRVEFLKVVHKHDDKKVDVDQAEDLDARGDDHEQEVKDCVLNLLDRSLDKYMVDIMENVAEYKTEYDTGDVQPGKKHF